MKLYVTSDLHYDYYRKGNGSDYIDLFIADKFNVDVDTVVLAGDIATRFNPARDILTKLADTFKNVVFCLGNHDLVTALDDHKFKRSEDKLDKYHALSDSIGNLHLLDGNTITIDGVKFGGSMGIWDMSYTGGYSREYLDEYWLRKWYDGKYWNYMDNNIERIREVELSKLNSVISDAPDVMVTHFSPLIEIPLAYAGSMCSAYFYFSKHISDKLVNRGTLWCSGHTHSALKSDGYIINPIGYPFETPLADKKLTVNDFIVEIDKM